MNAQAGIFRERSDRLRPPACRPIPIASHDPLGHDPLGHDSAGHDSVRGPGAVTVASRGNQLAHRLGILPGCSLAMVLAVWLATWCLAVPSWALAGPLRVMALGDSNTQGTDAYPALLQQGLDARYGVGATSVANRGINGLTAHQLADKLLSLGWLAEDPDVALIMIGGNDLATLLGSTSLSKFFEVVSQTVADIQDAVDLLKSHLNPSGRSPIVLVSAYPPNLLPSVNVGGLQINPNLGVQALNLELQSSLTNVDAFLTDNWDDLYDPLTGRAKPQFMRDAMHLNQQGRQVLADNWQQALAHFVPEPATLGLALCGASLLCGLRTRHCQRRATAA